MRAAAIDTSRVRPTPVPPSRARINIDSADKPAPFGTGGAEVNDFTRAGDVDPRCQRRFRACEELGDTGWVARAPAGIRAQSAGKPPFVKDPPVTDGPLIVQSDKTLLLEIAHPDAAAARANIAPFAELERSPEHIHTYRITPLALWNARAAASGCEISRRRV